MLPEFKSLVQSITDAIFVLDPDGRIEYYNPAAAQLTGYTQESLLNRTFQTLYYDTDEGEKLTYELSQTRQHKSFLTEGWKLRRDNTRFWADTRFSKMEGSNAGFVVTMRDSTDKKTNEVILRDREEQFRLMVEGVKEYCIFMLDPTGNILTWNEGGRRIKGYLDGEIIGKHFSIFYTREDLEIKKPEREIKIATATGKYEEEGWRVKKDGSVFWANIVLTSLYNQRNQHIGFSKVTRDLTDRRQNEEALRQSEERNRLLVDGVRDYGIFMLDEKGRIISWNEGARRIKGYEAKEIIGKYFTIFYPEEDILSGKPTMELRVATATGKYEEEGWRLRKDGTRFWANEIGRAHV